MAPTSIAFVTNSTAYMPPDLLEQYNIRVVPNVVNRGTQTYRDGVDITSTEFFERLKTDPVMPTTAVLGHRRFPRRLRGRGRVGRGGYRRAPIGQAVGNVFGGGPGEGHAA